MRAVMMPFERRALPDMVAERLMNAISEGLYRPGEQLPTEPELAQQLGVGRTSLREAISRLKTLGLVEVRSGLGTFVVEAGRSTPIIAFTSWAAENTFEVSEIFEARLALETAAAGLAAGRATAREITRLRSAADEHVAAGVGGSIADLVATDENFHRMLVSLSRNALLSRLYDVVVADLHEYRRVSLALPDAAHRSGEDHFSIVDAVARGDAEGAKQAVIGHIATLRSEIVDAARVAQGPRRNTQRKSDT